jgi:hypothetical protein
VDQDLVAVELLGDLGIDHRADDQLTLEGALIKEITAFIMPEIFPRLGLPPEL